MGRQRSILYVDDYQDACDLMIVLLTGYSVSTACSAAEALALLSNRLFDLYLLDYCLPDISGIDLCRQIRVFDPNTPIIFYSAAAQDGDQQDALAAGAQAYFVKPADLSQLHHTIEELTANPNRKASGRGRRKSPLCWMGLERGYNEPPPTSEAPASWR